MSVKIDADCPNCGRRLVWYQEGPYIECPQCGLKGRMHLGKLVVLGYHDLDSLNELRAENDLEPLSALPEQRSIEAD